MNRRTYLAALTSGPLAAAALSGCLDRTGGARSPANGESPTRTPSPSPTSDPPEGLQRLVQLDAVDDVPVDGLAIEAEVVEPSVTDEHPARVAVTTTNDGRKRDVTGGDGMCCLFNRSGGASEPGGLWLHRAGSTESIERDGDRWTRDRAPGDPRAYAAYACLPTTFATGKSLTNEYYVWDDYRVEGYLRPGVYRFAEEVTVVEPNGDLTEEADVLANFEWGFSVRVEQP
jgi:hypothetical protein